MPRKIPEAAVADFSHAIGLLARRLRAAAAAHGLSWTESSTLRRIATDGPATTAELARAEGVKPQSMGATLAALEARGLVARKPHPSDGRQVNLILTAQGVALRKSVRLARRTWLAQALAGLDAQDRATLFASGAILKRLAES